MKKCDVCNTIMIEDTNLHTDVVGGVSFEEQIYLTYELVVLVLKNKYI